MSAKTAKTDKRKPGRPRLPKTPETPETGSKLPALGTATPKPEALDGEELATSCGIAMLVFRRPKAPAPPLTEDDVRRIAREELAAALAQKS